MGGYGMLLVSVVVETALWGEQYAMGGAAYPAWSLRVGWGWLATY